MPAPTVEGTTNSPTTAIPDGEVDELVVAVERRVHDQETEGFEDVVAAVLADSRGWSRAGFRFGFDDAAEYRIILAEGDEVDRLCAPYDTGGRFSCQIGPLVMLNADRWRTATESWSGTLEEYRQMLVNHEVGHLLGQHHPSRFCDAAGEPAAVMAQQSRGLDGCAPNSWPLDWEIECAITADEPLAPPYEPTVESSCQA